MVRKSQKESWLFVSTIFNLLSLKKKKKNLTTNGYTHFSDVKTEDQWKCVNGKASI